MSFDWAPVYNRVKDSVFQVSLTPSDNGDDEKVLAELAKSVNTVEAGRDVTEILKATQLATGFAVGEHGGYIGIVTCAHSLQHLFTASCPLTRDKINRLFTVRIVCSHHQNWSLEAGTAVQYAVGHVLTIDCRRDLMMVITPLSSLMGYGGGQCMMPHPALRICAEGGLDPATRECLLVSWPHNKPDQMSFGHVSRMRRLTDFWQTTCAYDFDALEVDISAGFGSSGGPLLNKRGEVIGVLHGAHGAHRYFVSFRHVREFVPIPV